MARPYAKQEGTHRPLAAGAAASSSTSSTAGPDGDAPFQRIDHNPVGWTRCKIALGAVTLAPIRVAFLVPFIASYTAALTVASVLNVPRAILAPATQLVARVVLLALGFWTIEEVNRPTPTQLRTMQPRLVVSNHVSYLEILYFMATPLCPAFVMKATCLKVPFIGRVAMLLGGVLVDRREGTERGASNAIRDIVEAESGPPVLIFSEGTTSNGRFLLPFRTGAFRPGAPVLPVLVEFPFRNDEFSCAYESIATTAHVLRVLCQWRHKLRVTYLPLHRPTQLEKQDAALFANNVRQEIASIGGLTMTGKSFADKVEYHKNLMPHYQRLGFGALFLYVRPDTVWPATTRRPVT